MPTLYRLTIGPDEFHLASVPDGAEHEHFTNALLCSLVEQGKQSLQRHKAGVSAIIWKALPNATPESPINPKPDWHILEVYMMFHDDVVRRLTNYPGYQSWE